MKVRQQTPAGLPNACRTVVLLLLGVHATLLVWIAWRTSPNKTETAHVAAGLYSWQTNRFDVFNVNPPLVRAVATVPIVLCSPKYDWLLYSPVPRDRSEWSLGSAFIEANSNSIEWYFSVARSTCIPFCLIGGYACYRLAKELYGTVSGVCALALWCFSPILLGWGATICPDVAAAAFGVVAMHAMRQWLRRPCWDRALLAGLTLGLAGLTKFTLLVLYPLLPGLWLLYRLPECQQVHKWQWFREVAHISAIVALSVLVINVGYGFEGSFQRLGDYHFQTTTLTGYGSPDDIPREGANRFAGTWVGELPLPLPSNMVQGIDTQRYDFERGLPSYLRGEWADHGWWYYYLYALAIKEPLGTWCLVALAVGATIFGRGYSAPWRDEMIVLAPGLAILIFVSSQTGFSVHSRYIIPALPFLFVWTSRVGRVFEMRPFTKKRLAMAAAVVLALTWSVGSSLWYYPHSLSYFNELVGGPMGGPRHLLDSNIDWGQDLFYLKDWLDRHPEVKLDGLAYFNSYPATLAGIPETPYPPVGLQDEQHDPAVSEAESGPRPGWFALSVNYIYGRDRQYRYFLGFQPVATAGYSIYIYHVTLDEANRVRRELGLEEVVKDEG